MSTTTSVCPGHPAGPFDPMGETVFCDGTCQPPPPTIRRRGFRKAPEQIREEAELRLQRFAADEGDTLAELRPASYCGPGSAGDRGAYTLSLTAMAGPFDLQTIEAAA